MEGMLLNLGIFIVGAALVIWGGDFFLSAAIAIAEAFHIPRFVIGATVVSLATTLPELLVSLLAAVDGSAEIAVGNAIGSVTANTGLILSLAMLCIPMRISPRDYALPCLILPTAAGALCFGCPDGRLSAFTLILLPTLLFLFLHHNLHFSALQTDIPDRRASVFRMITGFLAGTSGIFLGSRMLISAGCSLASLLGISQRIIAVTMIAVGTSLPELVTTVSAILRKEAQLSLGNIIGANILDLTLILPLCSLAARQRLPVPALCLQLDMPVCFALTLLCTLPLLLRGKSSRLQGLCMLMLYALYLLFVI